MNNIQEATNIAPSPNQPVVEPNNGGDYSHLTHLLENFQMVVC